jgi:hypothetical protein
MDTIGSFSLATFNMSQNIEQTRGRNQNGFSSIGMNQHQTDQVQRVKPNSFEVLPVLPATSRTNLHTKLSEKSDQKQTFKTETFNKYQSENISENMVYEHIPVPIDMNINYNVVKHTQPSPAQEGKP